MKTSAILVCGVCVGAAWAYWPMADWPVAEAKGQSGNVTRRSLIGVWQAAPAMGAGWSEAYQFDAKGTFAWHASQANCEAREVSHSGTWKWQSGKLTLKTTRKKTIAGGKLVPATGSCDSKFEIQGGKTRLQSVRPPKTQTLAVKNVGFDTDSGHLTALVGGKRVWKFNDDPNFYDHS